MWLVEVAMGTVVPGRKFIALSINSIVLGSNC